MAQYLSALGFHSEIRRLRALCREANRDLGYWLAFQQSLSYHEATASACTIYAPEVIPDELLVAGLIHLLDLPLASARRTYYLHDRILQDDVSSEQARHFLYLTQVFNIAIRIVPFRERFGGAIRLIEFKDHTPLVYLEGHTIGLFVEDPEYATNYRMLFARIADAAFGIEQTKSIFADHPKIPRP